MAHIVTPEAEALLDKEIPVLDKGFVILRDYMGGDARVVQSARVSYGAGTKTVREDQGLIDYLMRNAHTSPFEQVSLVFHLKIPLFVFAQLVRHRTAKLNSMSARYSVMEDEFYFPEPEQVRGQGTANKQVGDGSIEHWLECAAALTFKNAAKACYADYEALIRDGVAREQARMLLPQNLYTQVYWKIDLHNLIHFLRLRMDWHAQQEIRAYAEPMATCAKAVAPMTMAAAEEHVFYAERFSRSEVAALRDLLTLHVADPAWSVRAAASRANLNGGAMERLVAKLLPEVAHG